MMKVLAAVALLLTMLVASLIGMVAQPAPADTFPLPLTPPG